MPKPRLLFYFLHLLGVGHVYRAQRLIRGFAAQGIAVDVIYGGDPIPGMVFDAETTHFLPPVRASDSTYSQYLQEDGRPLDAEFLARRKARLLEIFATLAPQAILTEAFPFGRRMVRHELTALFEEAGKRQPAPLMVSSVRDILQEGKKPERLRETCDLIDRYFDHILVHSDPQIIRLDATFPPAGEIANKLHYTGFVVPEPDTTQKMATYDVIVSAGGGAFGQKLLETAFETARMRPDLHWCFALGPNRNPEDLTAFNAHGASHIKSVPRLENLAGHMKLARLSISQCGYNTAMDVLAAHRDSNCRAIFVPYDTQGQTEQARRAQLLEQAGYAINLPQSVITPQRLLAALDKAMALPKVEHEVNLNGVANSAAFIRDLLDQQGRMLP